MHSTAEHKKKATEVTAALAAEPTQTADSCIDSDSDATSEDSDGGDSAYDAFVAVVTDFAVGDDAPPERQVPQIREATPTIEPATGPQSVRFPFQYWIDGELYFASSDAPSATFYRAAVIPYPKEGVSATMTGKPRRGWNQRRPRKDLVKGSCGQGK